MPIEVGPVSLFKNIFRIISKSTFPGTTFKSVCLSAIGCVSSIPRTDGHIGFDYRSTLRLVRNADSSLYSDGSRQLDLAEGFVTARSIINSGVYPVESKWVGR